jgi:hypothetical protein
MKMKIILASFYPRPVLTQLPQEISVKGFWRGQPPHLPKNIEPGSATIISAILIKKDGDFPRVLVKTKLLYYGHGRFLYQDEQKYLDLKGL